METIPEVFKKSSLKLNKISKSKEKVQQKVKRKQKPSESDRFFVDQIIQRDIENTLKTLNLNATQTNPSAKTFRAQRSLNTLRLKKSITSSDLKLQSTTDFKSDSEEVLKKPKKKKLFNEIPSAKLSSVINLLQLTSKTPEYRITEGFFTYYIGQGNNDLLIRKIMKRRKGWVKIPMPHTANFIWTQVKKSVVFEMLPRMVRNKKGSGDKIKISSSQVDNIYGNSNLNPLNFKLYNRLEGNNELANKKKLFSNMSSYYKSINKDPFRYIPLTFHITEGRNDQNYIKFYSKFLEIQSEMKNDSFLNNCWVIKPGESTNRGFGISVSNDINEITARISEKVIQKGQERTYIVQKYLYRPLLYKGRKFDIRCYALVTCINNTIQAYFYKDGYLRTSCAVFSMENVADRFIHLTNDAVQKHSENYGQFEDSNKLSYNEFQAYIDSHLTEKVDFRENVLPAIKKIVKDTVLATFLKLNPNNRVHTFEILGYDFMLDECFTPWLIEINTNPCLELSGNYLRQLIPAMVKNGLNIAIDQIFGANHSDHSVNNFELIFSQN